MENDPLYYPYPSSRMVTFAKNGMVATSQPLAAQAGLDILKKGGNAVDAAVATAACLTVVEPTSNGIGSDAFALVWFKNRLHGLNGSGPSPGSISMDLLEEKGHKTMPIFGWLPVTVPGAPGTWAALMERFGNLSLSEVLQPAISYAESGYPVSPVASFYWNSEFQKFKSNVNGELFDHWFKTFASAGCAPMAGEMWGSADHARTLRMIGESRAESFYRGELADMIDRFSRQTQGFLRGDDLAAFQPEWVEPIRVDYRGYDIWEIPPNGQGLIALMTLNILKGFDFDSKESVETVHKQIEALKLAFVDGKRYITEEGNMSTAVTALLSEDYALERRILIEENASLPKTGTPGREGTVYLATADSDGNMVSFIQSNYMGFGSGLVVPGTGIALQNRGANFSLDPDHDNCLQPGKRTYHTIIPGFITQGDRAVGPFGVMGGFMQPQGHVQVVMNLIDFQHNPQAALDAPRWQWIEGNNIWMESTFPNHIARALGRRGHAISIPVTSGSFGRGQIICRDLQTGVLAGGTEFRTDGAIAAW
ncbi:MAG: gamma-glutamyltransferase family protein [Proteobacteria bacterium]|nr:gamma-glutamyltransferase family protein [Pseudomonadota bacterium]